ncbi:MAG: cysteine dioxygenase family protein [Polyangiaceae bacterium]
MGRRRITLRRPSPVSYAAFRGSTTGKATSVSASELRSLDARVSHRSQRWARFLGTMTRGTNGASEPRRDTDGRSFWPELLVLAEGGKSAELRTRVARYFADSWPARPQPRAAEPYGRQVIHQGPTGEVMLAGWARGGRSAPHDHGEASGLVLVLEGQFSESIYRFDGRELQCRTQRDLGVLEFTSAQAGVVHDLHARSDGLTLHFYVPEIDAMRVYDVERRTTLLVTGDGGAWIPRGGAGVREAVVWAPIADPR